MLAVHVSATECCTGATPVPDTGIVKGDPVALLTIEMLPFTAPAIVGLNWTVRMRFCDGERVTGALPPVIVKPDTPNVIWEIVTLEFPVFVMVTFCEAEEVPVVTLPKLRLVGLVPSVRIAAIPVPVRATDVGEVAALLVIEMLPEAGPTEVGEVAALLVIEMLPEAGPTEVGRKATAIVVCCPAFTFTGKVNPLTLKKAEPVSVT